MDRRICIICETPFQIYNAVNLRNTAYKTRPMDIFIGKVFINADELIHRVIAADVFDCVFSYSNKTTDVIWKCKELFSPLKYVDFLLDEKSAVNINYDEILISSTTHFSMALIAGNRRAKVVYYDDGIGSYTDNIGKQNIAVKRQICYMLGNRHVDRFSFRQGFLYRPDLLINPQGKNFEKITLSEQHLGNEHIFNYQHDSDYEKKIVYFAMPSQTFKGKIQESDFLEVLKQYKEYCLIRLHPRENHPEQFLFASLDNGRNHWEMIAMNQINDQHILIGVFSTAQTVPKMIFDKEPYIIFTYKMYSNLFDETQRVNQDEFVCKLKTIYRNPSKIKIVQNIIEFNEAVKLCLGDNNE